MDRLAALLRTDTVDSMVVWSSILGLAGIAVAFGHNGQPEWAAFTLVVAVVVMIPSLLARDASVTFPAELVALVAAPVVLRVAGWFPQVTPFFAVGGLALLVAISLEAYTSLELTPRFAVVLTVITTMAFAGGWTIALWIATPAFGTALLDGQTELMWDLVIASSTGIATGIIFEGYLRYTDRLSRLRTAGGATEGERSDTTATDWTTDDEGHAPAVRGMQGLLAVLTAGALISGDPTLVVNSAVPLAVTFLPAALRREYGYSMDHWLVFWLTLAATLHTVGSLGLYEVVSWYDSLAHTVSASLVAVVGYAIARAAERHTRRVSFNPAFRGVFVLLFVLAAGVGWELLEFATTAAALVTGEPVLAQHGIDDTATDLVFDTIGGVVVASVSTDRFRGVIGVATEFVGVLVRRE